MRGSCVSLGLAIVMAACVGPAVASVTPVSGSADPVNGVFDVSVLQGSEWRSVGSLAFNQFPATRSLALGDAVPEGAPVRLRIVKVGGGAAHLDSVLIDGDGPSRVIGDETGRMAGLLARADHDLVDASDGALDLVFDPAGPDSRLGLKARIERPEPGGVPLQFPVANTFTPITSGSEFYRYPLDPSREGSRLWSRVFAEPCLPHSGHPEGITYGWVRHDRDTLYAAVDFTPDNTMDGGADFVTLWVNGADGPRAFTVTATDTRWGHPEFTTSAWAGYRHKIYRFAIPRAELGHENGPLELAFSAYGTVAVSLQATKVDALQVDVNGDGLVNPGDTIRYTIGLSSSGTIPSVLFNDTPDPSTTLVVGSVTTTQGTVTSGNTAGDTSVAVDVGTVQDLSPVTIVFDVVVADTVPEVVNQGTAAIVGGPQVPTDDPAVGGATDPTVTPVQPIPAIPTLSRVGLVGLAVLLLVAGVTALAVLRR